MLTCIIVEDQEPAQRILKKYIGDVSSLQLKGVFIDAVSAIQFLKSETIDVIFLDIHLPKISGIEFLEIIPKHQIILTTAFSDYALKGYEMDVVDYLLKPFSFQRFIKAVSKLADENQQDNTSNKPLKSVESEHDYIFLKSGHEFIKLTLDDIMFIKSESDYTFIITNTDKHLVSYSLKYWNERLDKKNFCQVHKSYIVNVLKIEKVSGNQIYLIEDDIKIPIGRTFKENFVKIYLKN